MTRLKLYASKQEYYVAPNNGPTLRLLKTHGNDGVVRWIAWDANRIDPATKKPKLLGSFESKNAAINWCSEHYAPNPKNFS